MNPLIAKWEMLNLQMGTSSLGDPQGFDGSCFPFFPFSFFFFYNSFSFVSPLYFYFYFFYLHFYLFKFNSSILIS